MKLFSTLFMMVLISSLFAGNGPGTDKQVNTSLSKITWVAKKVVGGHEGTVALKSGSLKFDGTTLKGGSFVIDMTTLGSTDASGGMKEKLDGHLKSDEFFGVATHTEAKFMITKVVTGKAGAYTVTGDLTIKGITKPITFEAMVSGNTATASMKVNRTLYDIKYGSGSFFSNLGDKAINDEFDLNVSLSF